MPEDFDYVDDEPGSPLWLRPFWWVYYNAAYVWLVVIAPPLLAIGAYLVGKWESGNLDGRD